MLTIRLARFGNTHRPFYHIVVADKEKPRDGKFIEQIGTYDPQKPDAAAKLDLSRVDHWTSVGAQLSPRVKRVVTSLRKSV